VKRTAIAAVIAAATALILYSVALWQDHGIASIADNLIAQNLVQANGQVDPDSAARTLALLDTAVNRTGAQWSPTDGRHPIRVVIHESSNIMETHLGFTQQNLSLKGYVLCTQTGPVIHMPAHHNTPFLPDRWESQTANHEAVHAAVCQWLGRERFGSLPLWFHEGLATLKQANSLEATFVQFYLRGHSRLHGPQTTDSIEFCYRLPNEGQITYATSTLFLMHLEDRWTGASERILKYLAQGKDFQNAFEDATLTTCEAAYDEWLNPQ
jgi:hypothetical protein